MLKHRCKQTNVKLMYIMANFFLFNNLLLVHTYIQLNVSFVHNTKSIDRYFYIMLCFTTNMSLYNFKHIINITSRPIQQNIQ